MTEYIRILFQNVEPLKIADDSNSQNGQVDALSYVPGTSLRGAVIGSLVRNGELEQYKTAVLSEQVSFLNAYVMDDKKEMVPSFKGFYEDKSDNGPQAKTIENMLINGEITAGNKRAALGKYCYTENDCIFYTDLEMGSDMKINKGKGAEKKNVFRNQYVVPGYCFAAYIAVRDLQDLCGKLLDTLEHMRETDSLFLGGNRSYGYGKCRILELERTNRMPYTDMAVQTDAQDLAYMVLLSNTAMISELGENVGIDERLLAKRLGLGNLEIQFCSTSVVDVRGYNRTWQAMVPSVKMYEAGSVFKLVFSGESVPLEKLRLVMDEGIGVRTNEGYGRVLFLDHYESLSRKMNVEISRGMSENGNKKLDEDEEKTLRIAAKGYYMNLVDRAVSAYIADEHNSLEKFGLNGAQLGTMESILLTDLYNGEKGFDRLLKYFETAKEKDDGNRKQKAYQKRDKIAQYVEDTIIRQELPELLGTPDDVMGVRYHEILTPGEIVRIKQNLLIQQIRFLNRGGRSNG